MTVNEGGLYKLILYVLIEEEVKYIADLVTLLVLDSALVGNLSCLVKVIYLGEII